MSVTVNIQAAGGFNHYWSNFYNDLANSPIVDGSDSAFIATDNGNFDGEATGTKFVISGTGFAYSGSFPNIHLTAGTITAIEIRDAANNVLATFTGFDISASAFNSAMATYVTGHGPNPGEDGNPDPSGFDAIFRNVSYNVNGYSGADTFEGGNLADTINGSAGADYINGAGGADVMTGGLGNDVYVVDDAGDDVNENAGEGKDSIHTYVSYTLSENVEYLNLIGSAAINGTGNDLNNLIFGNFAANTIYGMGGDDYIDGGAGADIMIGGAGNENYVVDNSGDQIVEADNEGFEQVLSSVTYTLSANVENLNLQGNAAINGTGNDGYNELFGNSAANVLIGLGGDDFLSGGEGADTMIGGTGDDIYMRDNTGDIVVEDAGGGIDRVYSTVSYTLSPNIENLTLTRGNLTGEGNELNNEIIGYYGGYTLMGFGGDDTLWGQVGADQMFGGTGDDFYYVEVAGDNVIENAGEGTDTVYTYVNHTLAANVENLEMHYAGHLTGNGNALNNKITGNSNNNVIDGGAGDDVIDSGSGTDILSGGAGADKFVFDPSTLSGATATTPIYDRIVDYGAGDSGIYNPGEGDRLDLSVILSAAYNQGSGQAPSSLVRAVMDRSGDFATLQVDRDGSAGGTNWTAIARLDNLHAGDSLNVILDSSLPAGSSITVKAANVVRNDFNGDGRSDVLAYNDNGAVADWQMNGAHIEGVFNIGGLAAGWHIAGTGDFNGDRISDILVLHDNGSLADWQMNGPQIESSTGFWNVAAGWHIAGTGDFNGDGKSDILAYHDNGAVADWQMNGASIEGVYDIGGLAAGWHIAGTGDFNGDGQSDILVLHDNGTLANWQMNGPQIESSTGFWNLAADWHIAGTGDFNADGRDDILAYSDSGAVASWQMNGAHIEGVYDVGGLAAGWHIAGISDFNGDGTSDILVRHDNGTVADWQISNHQIESNAGFWNTTADWHIV